MDRSEQIEEVSAALVGACGELHNVAKDAENPYFSSRYASLPAILDAVRPVLAKHGLSVIQLPRNHPESSAVGVETILLHASGQYLSQTILVRPAKDDPQGVGSAITYCRRYALAAALGIGQEDDDGNAASVPHPEPLRPAPAAPPARRPEPQRSAAHLQQQPARDPVPDRLQNGAINEAQAK